MESEYPTVVDHAGDPGLRCMAAMRALRAAGCCCTLMCDHTHRLVIVDRKPTCLVHTET